MAESRRRRPPPRSGPARRADVEVEAIAAGGDGVARVDGLVLFLPRTAPGDRGVAEFAARGRFARGRMTELAQSGPDRVEPPCQHYVADRCGGCQLQHLAIGAQREAKRRIVADALRRIGGRGDVDVPPLRAAPSPWRYRRKLTLALRRGATTWIAGLHPHDAPGELFALQDCPITEERVLSVWRDILAAGVLLPGVPVLRGSVTATEHGTAFTLEGGRRWDEAARFFAAVPSLGALWWKPEGQRRRLVEDRSAAGAPGASFVQVNPEVARDLQDAVIERALAHRPRTVIDGYAGSGDTAVRLAVAGVAVTAIELDRDAATWAEKRLPEGSRSIAARVEDALPEVLPADLILLNPPRSGLGEAVTSALQATAPQVRALLYVSCDPATLARDLRRLPAFRVVALQSFDMFPQTAHVETLCELVPLRETS